MRRQAMLHAAQAVFAEKGYTNATLDEVAHRAEFGKGTLYNYFGGGKEEILFAIFDEVFDDFCRLAEAAFTDAGDFRTQFQRFVEDCFRFFLERQEQFMLLIKEAHRMIFSDDPEKAEYFRQQDARLVQALTPGLERAVASGELKPFPAHALAHMILGNIKGYQTHMCLEQCRHMDAPPPADWPAEAARFITTMLLDGLMAHPDTPSSSLPDPT